MKLEFWASAEVHEPAFSAMNAVRLSVEPFLNHAFAISNLTALDAKIRYVPIIMPDGMRERYPARSRLRAKERLFDCAPQLNYDVFVSGSFEEQLEEYLGGIAESAPHLAKLGATADQVEQFKVIVGEAARRILEKRSEQARH